MSTDATTPLLVHVGGVKDARQAALSYDIGRLVWRGPAGAQAIAELEGDPVTGAAALFDFATYEYQRFGKDGIVGVPVRGSRLAASFAPGYFADHRDPSALAGWLEDTQVAQAALRSSGLLGDLVPTVALTQHWLTQPDLLALAVDLFSKYEGGVAVVLASSNNPLGAAEQIRGAVDLVRSTGNAITLRGDESAVGLLAHGAAMASVGTSSTTRHMFYGRPSKKPRRRPGHEVFHPLTMSWIKHYRLDAFAVPTEDLLCECAACEGRSILRLADPTLSSEVIAHSILSLQMIAAAVLAAPDPVAAWLATCSDAAEAADRLSPAVEQFSLGRSAKAWRSALQPAT